MEETDLKASAPMSPKSNISDPQPSLSALEEKIDKILKYQKTVRLVAMFRGFISFMIFLIFIVLPIVGGFYLFQFLQESNGLDKIRENYTEVFSLITNLKEQAGELGDLKDLKDTIINGPQE